LHPRKTAIVPTAEPSAFLGFVLMPGGRRRLPEDNVARFRNRLRGLRDRWRAGAVTRAEVEAKVGAWIAHAKNADTWRLRRAVFGRGWFGWGGGAKDSVFRHVLGQDMNFYLAQCQLMDGFE
jgi:RNA-directed DNA polymerase